ncbi:hypothetical protein BH24ACT15_BH24ACT15_21820 [soil metagenome]
MKRTSDSTATAPGGAAGDAGVLTDVQAAVEDAVAGLAAVNRWLDQAMERLSADGDDDQGVDGGLLTSVLVGLGVIDSAVAAGRAKAILAAEETELPAADGAVSTAAWLGGLLGLSGASAAREYRRATRLAGMPDTLAALTAAAISRDHAYTLITAAEKQQADHQAAERARIAEQQAAAKRRKAAAAADAAQAKDAAERARRLAEAAEQERQIRKLQGEQARRRNEEAAAAAKAREDKLLEQASSGKSPDQVNEAAKAERADDNEALRRSEAAQRSRRSVRDWIDESTGMGHFAIDLPGEDYERIKAALESATTYDSPDTPLRERRTPEQRRADGFVDLIDLALRYTENLPTSHGTRPQMTVTVSADTLIRKADRAGRGQFGTWLSADTIRRLACDARLARAVVSATSQVLDLGRQTRTWTAAQHRAAVISFGGCAFPVIDGQPCGRPPGWCDLHHVEYWRKSGPTDQANGVLLCRRHHTAVHHNGWQMTYDQPTNTVTITKHRPDHPDTTRRVDFAGTPDTGSDPPPRNSGERLPL